MKSNKKIDKICFFIPFIFTIAISLFKVNNNFKINGGTYEFLCSDFLLLSLVIIVFQLFFYLLFNKFIKNKKILIFSNCLMIFFIKMWPIILIIAIIGIIYKNENITINSFLDIFIILLGFSMSFVLIFNLDALYKMISFHNREKTYTVNKKIKVDKNRKHPNIYWIHMDGMPNIGFMKKYYDNDLAEFNEYLNDYYVNKEASFKGGHCTILALNALFNPEYYDKFMKSYLDELDYCELNKCETKKTIALKTLINTKMNNELFKSLKEADYDTIGITEFNKYTFVPADYIYNISNIDKTKKIKYFKNKYNDNELYKKIMNGHRIATIDNLYGTSFMATYYVDKELGLKVNDKKYEYIHKTSYLPIKAIIKSIEDSKNKTDNSKFYFIDNNIDHLNWDYDEKGKKLGTMLKDLNNFEGNYIYSTKILMDFLDYINDNDPNAVIIVQGDHGIHAQEESVMKKYYNVSSKEVLNIRNSTINAVYVPEEYRNGEEDNLSNPLNISRYLINNFVGKNYLYIK